MESLKVIYDKLTVGQSPWIDTLPFTGNPLTIFAILGVYLWFVLRAGPRFMQNRPAYKLKGVLMVYNLIQVIYSLVIVGSAFHQLEVFLQVFTFGCRGKEHDTEELQRKYYLGAYLYYIAKISELLDTVFFVLKKNQRQVTFLHVYHHFIMVLWGLYFAKYSFGIQGLAVGWTNTFVHIFMYSYYFLSAMGPQMQKYLWWKKYMTKLQLLQFVSMLIVLGVITAMDCDVPGNVTAIMVFLLANFLYLFARFYIQAYRKGAKKE